jgi:glycosyltransferase involved in cell wall biosynthesis
MKRRVLFVLPVLAGGAARAMLTVIQHLDRTRFEPHLAIVYAARDAYLGYRLLDDEVPADVPVHRLEKTRASRAGWRLLRTVRGVRPAAVVTTQGYVNFMLLVLRPLLGAPLVVREVIGERYLENNRYRDLLYRWYLRLVRGADRIVTQSEAVAVEMRAGIAARPGQVLCLHNPVDVEAIVRRGRAPSPFAGAGPHVLAVGRLTDQKGFDLLLTAFGEVVHAGAPGTLAIVGAGERRDALAAQAERLGIGARVRLVGFQADPYPWFAHADLFVLSSRYEGMPNVVLEALAAGCPVVAFDCPHGVRELVQDGVNGRLLAPMDIPGLTLALDALLRDPEARARLRAQVSATIAPFAAPAVAARWGTLFDGLAR